MKASGRCVLDLREDMHVHSTFSDGRSTIEENIAAAEASGLTRLCCVDHVRVDTPWVSAFVAAVRTAARTTPLQVFTGIEAKLLDRSGRLDLPPVCAGVDYLYIADHQVPLADGPRTPHEVRGQLEAGTLSPAEVIDALIDATVGALLAHPASVIAHAFSVLPKLGLSEADVPHDRLHRLADAARRTGALLEIDERWRCPSLPTVQTFRRHGVGIVVSTDSHRADTIGRYFYVRDIAARLYA